MGGFTASALESTGGLNVDNLDVTGALSSARLDEGDLAAGLYDNAEIEIWRVNDCRRSARPCFQAPML